MKPAEALRMDLFYFRELARQLEQLLRRALAEREHPPRDARG
jgi:hypothetical protein